MRLARMLGWVQVTAMRSCASRRRRDGADRTSLKIVIFADAERNHRHRSATELGSLASRRRRGGSSFNNGHEGTANDAPLGALGPRSHARRAARV